MDETDKNQLIDQFVGIAGVEKERATFFLESSNWNFELAIQAFFDNSEGIEEPADNSEMADEQANTGKPAEAGAQPAAAAAGAGPSRASRSSNIATFSSIREEANADPGQQAFYAGGSTHSGQQVLGPAGPTPFNSDQFVKEMFNQARQNAVLKPEPKEEDARARAFAGSGFTLGSSNNDSVRMSGSGNVRTFRTEVEDSDDSDEEGGGNVLRLWRNGFDVNGSELMRYEDPKNAQFLESIRRGEVPKELMGRPGNRSMRMEDHRHEDYVPPQGPRVTAFVGAGHRLGNPTGGAITTPVVPPPAAGNPEECLAQANTFLALNASEPNTRVQIRLADGSRLVAHINTARLVSDLRQFISLARPEYGPVSFELMTTFPNKVIDNEAATIAASGLANASIVQRLTK